MSAAEVAQAIKTAIGQSTAGYVQQITAVSGFQIADGEMFSISDGQVTTNFEFESGYSSADSGSGHQYRFDSGRRVLHHHLQRHHADVRVR
jgi:hypothetical protein